MEYIISQTCKITVYHFHDNVTGDKNKDSSSMSFDREM